MVCTKNMSEKKSLETGMTFRNDKEQLSSGNPAAVQVKIIL
jgi:hypothetical protein